MAPTHYVDHGGTGPAVVVLHSFLMDATMFAPQVQAFGADYRFIAIDQRGHGETPATGPFDYWDSARDVLGVLDELGIDRAAFVGVSQGGFVAMRIALLAAERVAALAVMGTSAAAENPALVTTYRQLAANWLEMGPIDPIVDMVATICLGDMDASDWKAKWRARPTDTVEVLINALVDRDDIVARLGEIDAPALVLHGSADLAYPLERARELAEGLPKAEAPIVVEGGAHFLSLTNPTEVNSYLGPFLQANV
ncbi:MAG TPA: alpha/beta hydrolase [Pseudonocardiaceae bacterium]|jgi:pimeloyl-ACP methyl ester carboxylesterase